MNSLRYVSFNKKELADISLFSLVLSIMFWFLYLRFSSASSYEISTLISFFLFLLLMLLGKFFIMKWVAARNCFYLTVEQNRWDRFGIKKIHRFSYFNPMMKGVPYTLLSIMIYVLTLGFIIFPNLWKYKTKKIEHLHLVSRQYYEGDFPIFTFQNITEYRISKAIFAGYIYYFVLSLLLKFLFQSLSITYFNWFTFILYWIAFFSLIPLPGEGLDLYIKNRPAWYVALTIMFWGMLFLLVFSSVTFFIILLVLAVILSLFALYWKKFLH